MQRDSINLFVYLYRNKIILIISGECEQQIPDLYLLYLQGGKIIDYYYYVSMKQLKVYKLLIFLIDNDERIY